MSDQVTPSPLRVLDLFSGIGGFSLGLERAGMRTIAFCEIDPFCRRVLAKHWPDVPIYDDVRTLSATRLAADGIGVDVICGGFPCQDISTAGSGAGLAGERSGLWREYARLVGEVRPAYVIVENVSALLGRGLGDVLGDLASIGYDAEWDCIPAAAVGAPHPRDRIWIVAHPHQERCFEARGLAAPPAVSAWSRTTRGWAHWSTEPGVGRVADGVPRWMDRVGALGNAVVPQIPELIGRALMSTQQEPSHV
jgi:DNA (cytosine-5)-methyltransferase 1